MKILVYSVFLITAKSNYCWQHSTFGKPKATIIITLSVNMFTDNRKAKMTLLNCVVQATVNCEICQH